MVVLGNYSVGKTNIVRRIFNKQFEEHSLTTIGIEFATLEINDQDSNSVFIQVWDTCKSLVLLIYIYIYNLIILTFSIALITLF